jgi:hypothetical protein
MAKQAQVARRAHWQQIIERQQASGLSIQRFCQRENLATASFFDWKRKLRQQGPTPQASAATTVNFAPVRIVPDASAAMPAGSIEIVLGRDRRIRLVGPVDRTTLADVLAVLEG